MKNIQFKLLLRVCFFLFPALLGACGSDSPIIDEKENGNNDNREQNTTVPSVTELTVEKTEKANELQVNWVNPTEAISVEISHLQEGDEEENAVKKSVRISTEKKGSLLIVVPKPGTYVVTAVALDNYGKRSEKQSVTATPLREEEVVKIHFLERGDILMTSLMNLCFGKSARDCWNTKYPLATGPYWDGDALVWGQGAGLSGYVALRGASKGVSGYEEKYADMTNRMYNGLSKI